MSAARRAREPSAEDSDRFEEIPSSPSTASFHSAGTEDDEVDALQEQQLRDHPVAQPTLRADLSTTEEAESGSQTALEEDEDEATVWWDPAELKDVVAAVNQLKVEGNALFGQGGWEMAMTTYRDGLAQLPVKSQLSSVPQGETKAQDDSQQAEQELSTVQPQDSASTRSTEPLGSEDDSEAKQVNELRSMLYANVAACCLKLERWKDAVEACDAALDDNPIYAKALHRRAMANEQIKSWASLTSAIDDYKALESSSDVNPAQKAAFKAAQTRLAPLLREQQEKEKDEVLSKLKDLGNTVLGKFGLSTDNFKFVEQPGGGYSMNFQR
ncbi:hypothetical protein OIV83_000032 [Microbotryomycetes sp. JL201]|nr:hypothetical protein OIV83_000032 [Microbotryomycetes sp. JL201]